MIDYTEISKDGEKWELFARDFFQEMGFYIESQPDRGADGKKDLIISEYLNGNIGNYKFTWLVSCKHFANRHGGKGASVTEKDEINIQERLDHFGCDGFIGFYSTLPSSAFNERLRNLKANQKIKDYRFFDGGLITKYLLTVGFSKLIHNYFPESYKKIKPLHLIFSKYEPLNCAKCNKDLLESFFDKDFQAIVAYVTEIKNGASHAIDMYWACQTCDPSMEKQMYNKYKLHTQWESINQLCNPGYFLKWIIATLNNLYSGQWILSKVAQEKEKKFIMCMAQKVFREMTQREKNELLEAIRWGL